MVEERLITADISVLIWYMKQLTSRLGGTTLLVPAQRHHGAAKTIDFLTDVLQHCMFKMCLIYPDLPSGKHSY